MAQLYCSGPVHVYFGLGGGGSPVYFGTSESAPRIEIKHYFNTVKNDIAGDQAPFDFQWVGETATISADFTRWNNPLWLQMMSRPFATSTAGINGIGDYGTFMVQEGATYQAWLQFPYASTKAAMAGLEAGFHFFSTFLLSPDSKTIGMRANKVRATWFATQVFGITTGNNVTAKLYDFSMQGLPSAS
ncbi:hypothetical protein AYO40_01210 [Planctomycetaceae bacterium SCGC AG-212-D15]|nr:hypothetical protein AYO40_01210 [Planctomycetaceae bacterium SCGC AG-212-D15]